MGRTKDYAIQSAAKFQKQLNTVPADLYGGANDVTLGAGVIKQFDSLDINDVTEKIVDSAINGTQADNYQETVARLPTVEISGTMHTIGDVDLLVSTMGWENLDGPKAHTAGKYTHFIPMVETGKEQREYTAAEQALVSSGFDADDRINTYMHLARELGPSVEHAKNVVIKSFEFSSSQKQELKIKMSGTAESATRDTSKTGLDAWTTTAGNYAGTFKHYHGKLSVGLVGGSAAEIQCLEFACKGSFGLAEGVVPTGTSQGGLSQAEPLSDGKTELTVDFRVYKHDTNLYKNWETGDTKIFLKMEYTRGDSFLGFYLPLLQVVSAQMEAGEGGSVLVSCKGFLPTAADPFTTERTVGGSPWAVPFKTRMYLIAKDLDPTNWLRKV